MARSLRAQHWKEHLHPRDDRGRFARKGGMRWAGAVLRQADARFGDTSLGPRPGESPRGRLAGGLIDTAAISKAAPRTVRPKGTFERGPGSATSSNAGTRPPVSALKKGDHVRVQGEDIYGKKITMNGYVGEPPTMVRVRRPGVSRQREEKLSVTISELPNGGGYHSRVLTSLDATAERTEPSAAMKRLEGLQAGRAPGGIMVDRSPVKRDTGAMDREVIPPPSKGPEGARAKALERVTEREDVSPKVGAIRDMQEAARQAREAGLPEGSHLMPGGLDKARAARREKRIEELKDSNDPKDNGAKIRALEAGTLDTATLYKQAMAGPSGQRRNEFAGRIRHTPDNPSGEFQIRNSDGDVVGWASRTVRNSKDVYTVHSESGDGTVRLEGWAGELSTAADVLVNGEFVARSSTADSKRISAGTFERYAGRNMSVEELQRQAAKDELRRAQEALANPKLTPGMRATHERAVARLEEELGIRQPMPDWGGVRAVPADELREGDVFIKPNIGVAFSVSEGGVVAGKGFQPLEGTRWTVTGRSGNTITARNDAGQEISQDIPADRKINVLRVGTEGPKPVESDADRIARMQRETEAKVEQARLANLSTRAGVPPTDGRADILSLARRDRWEMGQSRNPGRKSHMPPDAVRAGGGYFDDQPASVEATNPADGTGPYRYRIYNDRTGVTLEEGTFQNLDDLVKRGERIYASQRGEGMARPAGKAARFEARQVVRPKDASRGDIGSGPFYDNKVFQLNPDGTEREVSSHMSPYRAEDEARDRNVKEAALNGVASAGARGPVRFEARERLSDTGDARGIRQPVHEVYRIDSGGNAQLVSSHRSRDSALSKADQLNLEEQDRATAAGETPLPLTGLAASRMQVILDQREATRRFEARTAELAALSRPALLKRAKAAKVDVRRGEAESSIVERVERAERDMALPAAAGGMADLDPRILNVLRAQRAENQRRYGPDWEIRQERQAQAAIATGTIPHAVASAAADVAARNNPNGLRDEPGRAEFRRLLGLPGEPGAADRVHLSEPPSEIRKGDFVAMDGWLVQATTVVRDGEGNWVVSGLGPTGIQSRKFTAGQTAKVVRAGGNADGGNFAADARESLREIDPRKGGGWNLPERAPAGAKIETTRTGNIKSPRTGGRAPGGAPRGQSVNDAVTTLNTVKDRDAARTALAGMTLDELDQVAAKLRDGGLTTRRRKEDKIDDIVEYAVGRRQDSEAIERAGRGPSGGGQVGTDPVVAQAIKNESIIIPKRVQRLPKAARENPPTRSTGLRVGGVDEDGTVRTEDGRVIGRLVDIADRDTGGWVKVKTDVEPAMRIAGSEPGGMTVFAWIDKPQERTGRAPGGAVTAGKA